MLPEPKIIIVALLGGLVPALLWLWFWLKDDGKKREPRVFIFLTFLAGMLGVFIVLPIQKLIDLIFTDQTTLIISWAVVEEVIKFSVVALVVLRTRYIDEPTDFAVYLVTGALGFAALENALFLIDPLSLNDNVLVLLTGHLRFLGAMVMHVMASSMVGIALGFAFYKRKAIRRWYLLIGLLLAIALHAAFNLLIIEGSNRNVFIIFAVLWVVAIIRMLIFERVRTLGERVG